MASRPPPIPPRPGMMGKAPMPNVARPLPKPPAPSLVPKIRPGTIERVDDISGSGQSDIWIVTVTGGTKVVVKLDAPFSMPGDSAGAAMAPKGFAQKNMAAMNMVMQQASPTAMTEPLDKSEVDALGSFKDAPKNLAAGVIAARSGKQIMVKMKHDASFTASSNKVVANAFPDRLMSDQDKTTARLLFEDLRNNEPAWRTLGQVVIADTLIGNGDRVDLYSNKVTNFGNLIFSRDGTGKITHALGYDSLDPFAGNLKNMYGVDIEGWIGTFGVPMADKNMFPTKAQAIIAWTNQERLTPLGMAPYTGNEARSFSNGLMIGWDKQANAIGTRVRAGKPVPSGLMARAKYLRWVR